MGPDADRSSGCILLRGLTLECRLKSDWPTNSTEMGGVDSVKVNE